MTRAALRLNPLLAGFFMAVALLLAGCGGGGGGDSQPLRVAIYGDSIPFGYDLEVSPIQRIRQARPEWVIDDRTAGGLQLRQLIDGYAEPFSDAPSWVYPSGPQPPFAQAKRDALVLVIQLGANDVFRDGSRCEEDMRAAITIAMSEGRAPVLTGIVGFDLSTLPASVGTQHAHCNAAFRALATEYGIQHAGWDTDYSGPQDLKPDGVHRTQEASDRLAALLIQAIERADR